MNPDDQLPDDLARIGERLREERPETTPLELDRIKQMAMKRAAKGGTVRSNGRTKLVSVLAAAAVAVGGTGVVIAAAGGNGNGNGNGAGPKQYCPPTSQKPGEPKPPGGNCGKGDGGRDKSPNH